MSCSWGEPIITFTANNNPEDAGKKFPLIIGCCSAWSTPNINRKTHQQKLSKSNQAIFVRIMYTGN